MTVNIVTVNCIGLQCPAPILEISKVAKATARPATLEVRSDDGDFAVDVRAWCRSTGAVLESLQEQNGTFVARIALESDRAAHAAEADAEPSMSRGSAAGTLQRLELDCRGMICPAPILQLSRAVREIAGPALVVVRATDGDFPRDVEAWCRSMSARLVRLDRRSDGFEALIAVNDASVGSSAARSAPGVPLDGPLGPGSTPPAPEPSRTPPPAPTRGGVLDLRGRASELGLLELGQRVIEHQVVRFVADHGPIERQIRAWAAAIGASLDLVREGQLVRGTVQLDSEPAPGAYAAPSQPHPQALPVRAADVAVPRKNKGTILVLRNDFEGLMAAMMVANASAAQGMAVDVYFAFWGVNVLRSRKPKALVRTSPLKRMMKWMMPAGPESQPMSKFNFAGIGLGMMKGFMREQKVLGLSALMREAAQNDVKFIVCTMSMSIMGLDKADLMELPNLEFGGVTSFSGAARESAFSLVF